jgi:UDP-N-acetylglucosamine 2-epimerase (non-hydrolysing)
MKTKLLYIIVGTRPNFIKVTRFKEVANSHQNLEIKIIHTGQHFDDKMSKIFFTQFRLQPDEIIDLSAGTANSQIAEIMVKLEDYFAMKRPDCVMVVGDVNSTLAAALVTNKMGIMLVHLESGLRSFDRTMPEEVNRVLTDQIADHLFVTEQSGIDNLLQEGKQLSQVHFVGNTMIDTMLAFGRETDASNILQQLRLHSGGFALMTMHRPATVDNKEGFEKLLNLIDRACEKEKMVFPVHPRTKKNISLFGFDGKLQGIKNLVLTEPLDYFAFQKLIKECHFIITDSGGIQEEATLCGVPCLTLRPNTERPVTVTRGTNTLIPFEAQTVMECIGSIEKGTYKKGTIPELWDGHATERVLETLSIILA